MRMLKIGGLIFTYLISNIICEDVGESVEFLLKYDASQSVKLGFEPDSQETDPPKKCEGQKEKWCPETKQDIATFKEGFPAKATITFKKEKTSIYTVVLQKPVAPPVLPSVSFKCKEDDPVLQTVDVGFTIDNDQALCPANADDKSKVVCTVDAGKKEINFKGKCAITPAFDVTGKDSAAKDEKMKIVFTPIKIAVPTTTTTLKTTTTPETTVAKVTESTATKETGNGEDTTTTSNSFRCQISASLLAICTLLVVK